jgi:hypothetical protein
MYYSRENSQSALLESSDFSYSSSARTRSKMTYTPRKDAASGLKDKSPSLTKDIDVNVGFSDLPNQIHRKTGKKGFEFTLMVAGKCFVPSRALVSRFWFYKQKTD